MEGLTFKSHRRNGDHVGEFTTAVQNYRHEWLEGPDNAYWKFVADNESVRNRDLLHWFDRRMMTQVRVLFRGSEVWRGHIGYIQLNYDGAILTKDVRTVANAAKCQFSYEDSTGVIGKAYTNWHINEASLADFGEFDIVLKHNGRADGKTEYNDGSWDLIRDPDTNAPIIVPDDIASSYVARHASPFTQQIAPGRREEANSITFKALGAIQLADYILLSDGPLAYGIDRQPWQLDDADFDPSKALRSVGSSSDYGTVEYGDQIMVSDEIHRIVDMVNYTSGLYGEPLLFARHIEENDRVTIAGVDSPIGAMTRLRQLADLRNNSNEYYQLQVDIDGGVTYSRINTTPRYYMYRPPHGLRTAGGHVPTWEARPEFIKIVDAAFVEYLPDTWLGDGSLILPERVTMRDGAEQAAFGPLEKTEADFDSALDANQRRVKRAKK